MILVSTTGMSAPSIEGTATRAVTTGSSDCLTLRRIFWRGEKHLPKRKGRDAGEDQQKHAKMYPTGRVHSGLLPRPGCQFHSTERM